MHGAAVSATVVMQWQHKSILAVALLQLQIVVEEMAAAVVAAAACYTVGPQDGDPAEV